MKHRSFCLCKKWNKNDNEEPHYKAHNKWIGMMSSAKLTNNVRMTNQLDTFSVSVRTYTAFFCAAIQKYRLSYAASSSAPKLHHFLPNLPVKWLTRSCKLMIGFNHDRQCIMLELNIRSKIKGIIIICRSANIKQNITHSVSVTWTDDSQRKCFKIHYLFKYVHLAIVCVCTAARMNSCQVWFNMKCMKKQKEHF